MFKILPFELDVKLILWVQRWKEPLLHLLLGVLEEALTLDGGAIQGHFYLKLVSELWQGSDIDLALEKVSIWVWWHTRTSILGRGRERKWLAVLEKRFDDKLVYEPQDFIYRVINMVAFFLNKNFYLGDRLCLHLTGVLLCDRLNFLCWFFQLRVEGR